MASLEPHQPINSAVELKLRNFPKFYKSYLAKLLFVYVKGWKGLEEIDHENTLFTSVFRTYYLLGMSTTHTQ